MYIIIILYKVRHSSLQIVNLMCWVEFIAIANSLVHCWAFIWYDRYYLSVLLLGL